MTEQTPAQPAHPRTGSTARCAPRSCRWETPAACWWRWSSSSPTRWPRPTSSTPWSLSDVTFNFTEKALIALAMALLIIAGEIDLSVASIIALASTADGHGPAIRRGHRRARRDRHRRGLALRRLQWLPGHAARAALDRGHHRHDEPLPRHQLHHPRRPGLYKGYPQASPSSARAMSGGWCASSSVLFLAIAAVLLCPAAPNEFRPPHLRHRQQPDRGALLGRARRAHQVHAVLPDRPDVRHRRRAADQPPRLDAAGRSRRAGSSRSSPWWCWAASTSWAARAPSPAS